MNGYRPLALIILDGWGYRPEAQYNPCIEAKTPFIDQLFNTYPHRLIEASGEAVGLPAGQMGNSEVGHLHLGAGRLLRQDLTRISHAIHSGELEHNAVLQSAINKVKSSGGRVHIMGLLSPGGVHSHETHIIALIRQLANAGVSNYLHAFLDGRDVPPRSATSSIESIESLYQNIGQGQVASLTGRYFAMDRDQRWERTEAAYNLVLDGQAPYHSATAAQALEAAYQRGETDEFVQATAITTPDGETISLKDNDAIIFMNFRADRARQLSHALVDPSFNGFKRQRIVKLTDFVTLTPYADSLAANIMFPASTIKNTLGEVLSQNKKKQLRLAETEKYAHVTYFFNGGREAAYPEEAREMIASPRVATYDLQPAMSAEQLTDHLCAAIDGGQYDVIICNYANPDMVGHTGVTSAAVDAMHTMDHCLKRAVETLNKAGGAALITADHGNIECMYDETKAQPHTAHTTNPVPLLFTDKHGKFDNQTAALSDVAPTMLSLLGLAAPKEMTGRNLVHFE